MYLARKGFGTSGQAARRRPKGFFDGWPEALRRYNARRDRTADGRFYSEAYAEKIRRRAENPTRFEPIEIREAMSMAIFRYCRRVGDDMPQNNWDNGHLAR